MLQRDHTHYRTRAWYYIDLDAGRKNLEEAYQVALKKRGQQDKIDAERREKQAAKRLRQASYMRRIKRLKETKAHYDLMMLAQSRQCAICGVRFEQKGINAPHRDHNHNDGELRGLLCRRCNSGLGYFGDCPKTLIKAHEYLSRWPSSPRGDSK